MIIEMSAIQIAENIRTKKLGIVETASAFINQIEKINPLINAIHQFDPDRILKQAASKEQKPAIGKLHGVPISLKDGFYTPGFRGAKGSCTLFEQADTSKAATAVQRLLAEGAIILGITNVPEFLAAAETDNLLHGRTNNPYDLTRVAGGSSGGEAALIAAGGSCLGLGSDAGGSIRTPAHCCGIVGYKPTKGRIPVTGNIPNDSGGLHTQLATFGPMARYVEDIELMLSIVSGPDGQDPDCPPVPLQPMASVEIPKLKVLYFLDNGIAPATPETKKAILAAVAKLKSQVASIEEVTPPEIIKETFKLVWETCYLGGNSGEILAKNLQKLGQTSFSPLYNNYLEQVKNSTFSNAELQRRIAEMYQYKREMLQLMSQADILLSPVNACPARKHGTTHAHLREVSYAMTHNLTGWPAASINCGFSDPGLPIGLQIAAKPWEDHVVLAFAQLTQRILGIPKIVTPAS